MDASSSEPAPAGFKQLFRRVRELRSTGGAADDVSVLVTSQPNKMNWFSAVDHEDPSSMFVHADDYGWLTAAPSAAVVAHQIVENVAECFLIAHGVSLEEYAHEVPRGCLHDFCGDRADLALKLRTADLCADCTWTLRELNASPPAIAQLISLLEVIRRSCLVVPREGGGATGLYLELPYPAAVLRHRLDLARPGSVERVRRMIDFIDTACRLSVFEELAVGASIREPLESITIGKLVSTLQHLDTHRDRDAWRLLCEIPRIRNNEAHGFGEDIPAGDDQLLRQAVDFLGERLRGRAQRARYVFVRGEVDFSEAHLPNGCATLDVLMGSNLLFDREERRLKQQELSDLREFGAGQIYLEDKASGRLRPLHPFVRLMPCSLCQHERVLMADEVPKAPQQPKRFIDPLVGHRVSLNNQ
jgi:hypothetical protein